LSSFSKLKTFDQLHKSHDIPAITLILALAQTRQNLPAAHQRRPGPLLLPIAPASRRRQANTHHIPPTLRLPVYASRTASLPPSYPLTHPHNYQEDLPRPKRAHKRRCLSLLPGWPPTYGFPLWIFAPLVAIISRSLFMKNAACIRSGVLAIRVRGTCSRRGVCGVFTDLGMRRGFRIGRRRVGRGGRRRGVWGSTGVGWLGGLVWPEGRMRLRIYGRE